MSATTEGATTGENPFVKKEQTQQETKPAQPKRGRPPSTPSFDHVLNAIGRGEYDDDLIKLRQAIQERNEARREQVMVLVHEVFGEAAVIEYTSGATSEDMQADFTRSRMGVMPEPNVDESIGAPMPGQADPDTLADTLAADAEDRATPDSLAHLDEVERQMANENPGTGPVDENPVPLERRGAAIGGLHSSDIGD